MLTIDYKMPLNIPVTHRTSIGTVSGRIYRDKTDEGLSPVIVRLGATSVVTDSSGRFRFLAVKPGTCYLSIDVSRVDPELIAAQSLPIELTVESAKETKIEVGVNKSASLCGQIMLYHFEKEHISDLTNTVGSKSILPDHGLADTMLELEKGPETKRIITDRSGSFAFQDLRPGIWTLRIHHDKLPKYHYFEQDTYDFNLVPG